MSTLPYTASGGHLASSLSPRTVGQQSLFEEDICTWITLIITRLTVSNLAKSSFLVVSTRVYIPTIPELIGPIKLRSARKIGLL